MEDLLKVGVITTTHGVRGEVKVFPTTDDAERFLDIEYVLLDTGKELRRLNIQNVKFFKNLAILKFEGVDNINDIEMYKGRDLWIPREEAQELGEDEYYVADLIGMDVLLENGEKFGVLRDVIRLFPEQEKHSKTGRRWSTTSFRTSAVRKRRVKKSR